MRSVSQTAVLALLLLLLGCASPTAGNNPATGSGVTPIQIRTVSWDFAVGEFRLAFALLDGENSAQNIDTVSLAVVPLEGGGEPVWTGTAVAYDDYEIPYWVGYPVVDDPGFWGVVATITPAEGAVVTSEFVIEVAEVSGSPALGAAAPLSQNKTVFTEPDLSQLSSGVNPDPAFYQQTVAEAVAAGQPTVVGFITPGFCETRWCAPVLGSLQTVRQSTGDAISFIHIEVFDDFQELTYVPEMAAWGLGQNEPWVFVLDENGRIAAKFSGPLSPRELEGALAPLAPTQ